MRLLPKLLLVSHFHNEELLLASWCIHHRDIFDSAVLINHRSTDRSVEIIQEYWPKAQIVDSNLPHFDCTATDQEVMEYERLYTEDNWMKIALNTTEFIWHPDFKEAMCRIRRQNPDVEAFGIQSFRLVDVRPHRLTMPVYLHRHYGFIGEPCGFRRFVHRGVDGRYGVGRHSTELKSIVLDDIHLLHMFYSPWPECIPRKLQIQHQIPQSDKQAGFGTHHLVSEQELEGTYEKYRSRSENLMENSYFRNAYLHFFGRHYK